MTQVDPFAHVVAGARVTLDIGEKRTESFLVERVEPARNRIHLRAVDGVEDLDLAELPTWRVYTLHCATKDSGVVRIPTELKQATNHPPALELAVLAGRWTSQRTVGGRATPASLRVRIHARDLDGDVLELTAGGVAIAMKEAPQAPIAVVVLDLRSETGVVLLPGVRGRVAGSWRESNGTWRWRVQFQALSAKMRQDLAAIIHDTAG